MTSPRTIRLSQALALRVTAPIYPVVVCEAWHVRGRGTRPRSRHTLPPATSVTADAAEHSWPADARPGSTRRCPKVVHLTLLRGALMGPSSWITQRPSLDGTDRTHGAVYAPGDPRHMTRDYPVSET